MAIVITNKTKNYDDNETKYHSCQYNCSTYKPEKKLICSKCSLKSRCNNLIDYNDRYEDK